jgi:adenosylhomocysteine nucleosidase
MTDMIEIDMAKEDVADDRPIGIISAIPEEEQSFAGIFQMVEEGERHGFKISHGTIGRKPVVLVKSGVGKVNAAMAAMMLITEFYCGPLIMAGVAGSLDPAIPVGDIVIGTRLVQHDYGAMIDRRIKAYQPGELPLPGLEGVVGYAMLPKLEEKVRRILRGMDLPTLSPQVTGGATRVPNLHFGTIVSGDTFVNCPATRDILAFEFGALAVEMEGAAIAQVADRFGHPLVVVRAVSDLAGSRSHIDFPAFARDVSNEMAAVVKRLVTVF